MKNGISQTEEGSSEALVIWELGPCFKASPLGSSGGEKVRKKKKR